MRLKIAIRHSRETARRPIRLLGLIAIAGLGLGAVVLLLASAFPADTFFRLGLARFGFAIGIVGSIAFVIWGFAVSIRHAFSQDEEERHGADAIDLLGSTRSDRRPRR